MTDAAASTDESLSCEVLELTRDLIRLDTTNAPGNETRAGPRPEVALVRQHHRDAGADGALATSSRPGRPRRAWCGRRDYLCTTPLGVQVTLDADARTLSVDEAALLP